jgi:hypothetical protein
MADPDTAQCAEVTADQANKAAKLLPRGAKVRWFCPQCGDKDAGPWTRIDRLSVAGSGDAQRRIRINGGTVDLAYLFYLAKDGAAHNVAKAVGCPVKDVPDSIVGPTTPLKRYKLDLSIEVKPTKANGASWELIDQDAPDPRVRGGVYLGGKEIQALACGHQDSFRLSCLNGTMVEVNAETTLVLVVEDKDPFDNDLIGGIETTFQRAIVHQGQAVEPGKVTGQIKSATMTLTPVK